jgi:hypothetical protein
MGTPRSDFDEAVAYYVKVISEVTSDQWELPARGTQSVLAVAAQGSRPLTTTRDFLAAGAAEEEIHNTVGYFVRSKPVDAETAAGIQRRGAEALERIQSGDPATIVADLAAQVLAPVHAAPDDAMVGTQFGGMRLLPYLPTRTLELMTCSVEIAHAIGSETPPPDGPIESTARLLSDIAIANHKGALLVRVLWTQVQLG